MIAFDLKCSGGHVFEAWFASSAAFEEQRVGRLIACPLCGDQDVAKALMAPNVAIKSNRRPAEISGSARARDAGANAGRGGAAAPGQRQDHTGGLPDPAQLKAALAAIAEMQAEALASSQWVGGAFAERARAMHAGDEPSAPIHGQATPEDARALIDEGVPVAPLLVPVVPPEARN